MFPLVYLIHYTPFPLKINNRFSIYMGSDVEKKCTFFCQYGRHGGGGGLNNQTGHIWLPSYLLTNINQHVKGGMPQIPNIF